MSRTIITRDELYAAIRAEGVLVEDMTTLTMPTDANAQWELLAPYVGQPISTIPKHLILLFTSDPSMNNATLYESLRRLPQEQRMVRAGNAADTFI